MKTQSKLYKMIDTITIMI